MAPRRIIVLGCAGAGKTTFARRLSQKLGASLVCLDDHWRSEWGPDDLPAFRQLVILAHAEETWVSDGNFATATFDLRLPRADLIVWMERPRWLCLWRAAQRTRRPGEPHQGRDLWKVLRFIWGFHRKNRPMIERLRMEIAPLVAVVHLTSDAESDRFLHGLVD